MRLGKVYGDIKKTSVRQPPGTKHIYGKYNQYEAEGNVSSSIFSLLPFFPYLEDPIRDGVALTVRLPTGRVW